MHEPYGSQLHALPGEHSSILGGIWRLCVAKTPSGVSLWMGSQTEGGRMAEFHQSSELEEIARRWLRSPISSM